MIYSAEEIAKILDADARLLSDKDMEIRHLAMDTRKLTQPAETLFFALSGSMHDGHEFLNEALDKGVKNIVVEKNPGLISGHINVFLVNSSLKALQKLAAHHKSRFQDLLNI